jgi:hypothetical protein
MPLSGPTVLANGFNGASGTGTGTFSTGSFTTVNNSLVVFRFMYYVYNFVPGTSSSLTGGGLTWTRITQDKALDASSVNQIAETWVAQVTTGASISLTWSNTGSNTVNDSDGVWSVSYFTGHNTSTPTGASISGLASATSGTESLTLSGAPASSSIVIGYAEGAGSGTPFTPGSGLSSVSTVNPEPGVVENISSRGSSTSTAVSWTYSGLGANEDSYYAALEIIAAATSGPTPSDCSMVFQPSELLNHPKQLDTNQLHRYDAAPPETKVGNPQLDTGPYNPGSLGSGVLGALDPGDPSSGPTTPSDCSMLFQPSENLVHPRPLDTNQSLDNAFAGWAQNQTPVALAFWFQPPTLGPVPKSTQNTNQAFSISPAEPKTATAFWLEPTPDLQHHVPTIYTAQSFVCNPTIGPPVPGWYTQVPDLLKHPYTLDTNQSLDDTFAGWTNNTPSSLGFFYQAPDLLRHPAALDTNQSLDDAFSAWGSTNPTPSTLGFWTQAPDLLKHPGTVDTNQPLDDAFFGWAQNLTPTSLGFWTEAPTLLQHPSTLDTRQQFEFNPPAGAVTPADCSFLFQANALLNHAQTLDTNQPLDDAFAGWAQNITPTALGFWTQAPDLLRHPSTVDTNQSRVSYQDKATPASLAFWTQPLDLLRHPATVDTNQPVDDAFSGWAVLTPTVLGFWQQPQDLLRHPGTLDTNQPKDNFFSGWAAATPTNFGFFTQAPDLLRHANTIDTNESFEFNPPAAAVTPSAYWWYQPPDLLRHPPHLDTNQPRLVGQTGATPSSMGWWRQPEHLFKHPVPLDTRQPFVFLPPPQPPFGWFVQAQALLRHPVQSILGGQYSFALLPVKSTGNAITRAYFFD